MTTEQQQIRDFMTKAGQATPDRPTLPDRTVREGRLRWLAEELCELANAWGIEFSLNNRGGSKDSFRAWPSPNPQHSTDVDMLVESYDASLDLIVFAVGNFVAMGIDGQPGWDEVHSSNMSKFIDGHRRADGKWMKGPSYRPANLSPIVKAQTEAAAMKDRQQTLNVHPA